MQMCRKVPDFKDFFDFWAEKVLYQIHEENRSCSDKPHMHLLWQLLKRNMSTSVDGGAHVIYHPNPVHI